MTEQQGRSTFNTVREVIEHAVGFLQRIGAAVDELQGGDHGERVEMLLRSLAVEQRNLLGALERYVEDLPDKVGSTYSQYSVELPEDLGAPEAPLTTLGLIQWLNGLNSQLDDLFTEQAETAEGDIAAALGGIAEQVQAHERKLSKEYQRLEDL